MTCFKTALQFIKTNAGNERAEPMAKLILSLANPACPYPMRECFVDGDDDLNKLALEVVASYGKVGGDVALAEVGREVGKMYPRLIDAGLVMTIARKELLRKWGREDVDLFVNQGVRTRHMNS